jgi:putative ABC transport system ATP-binding protein
MSDAGRPPGGGELAVRCRRLTRTYGSGEGAVAALRGVDLDVWTGELLVLLGPSGCGKTTLVSIVAGVLEQDDGDCVVFGQDIKRLTEPERSRLRNQSIGLVFQAFNLLPALTALENVSVPLLIRGIPRTVAEHRAREQLDAAGLGPRSDAMPMQLSGGEQQRVAIARALVHEPKLIVCDEPTSNLDTSTGHDVMQLLRQLTDTAGCALVVVSHDPRVAAFADRIARMEDGRIIAVDTPAQGAGR